MQNIALFSIIVLIIFHGCDCESNPIIPAHQAIKLTLEKAEYIKIQITLSSTKIPIDILVERDTMIVFNGILNQQELLLIDSLVLPGERYIYRAYIIDNGIKQDSTILQVDTPDLDSTSHNIFWQIDTIGKWQSRLFDVWGTDPNNVYAVGFIYTSDTSNEGTSVMHWDGKKWNAENYWVGSLYSIFGFSRDDIWVSGWNGASGVVGYWNGSEWKSKYSLSGKSIQAIWGESSNNLFMVGTKGTIIHYDGSNWTTMNSGTNIDLFDIWGFSEKQVYASGYDISSGRGCLLYYNGENWKTLYDNIWNGSDTTSIPAGQTTSVWGYDTSHVVIWTSSGSFIGSQYGWEKIKIPFDRTFINNIRGSSQNNIVMTGSLNLILHWNGKSWFRYDEIYKNSSGNNLYHSLVFKHQVFVVGSSASSRGIVYRGTMVY